MPAGPRRQEKAPVFWVAWRFQRCDPSHRNRKALQLGKNPMLHLILGGAAVYRCDKQTIFNKALAAEVRCRLTIGLFPQPV